MKKIVFLLFIISGVNSYVVAQQSYRYWIPYVDTVHKGVNNTISYAVVSAFEDCNIEIEGNQYQLLAYDYMSVKPPLLKEGLLIESDRQIQIYYLFGTSHNTIYEDGFSQYHILEESYLGTDYLVPFQNSEISILAVMQNTNITIDGTLFSLDEGQSKRFSSIPVGTKILSDKPISIALVNYTNDHYGSTYTFQVYPYSMIGSEYFSPNQHKYSYGSSIDSTSIFITAIEDGTTVTYNSESINLNAFQSFSKLAVDESSIRSDKPIYIVYLNKIYGKDPWAGIFRYYDAAFQLLPNRIFFNRVIVDPVGSTSHGFPAKQICITSVADDNKVSITCGDSIRILDLDKGQRKYYHVGEFPQWNNHSMDIFSVTGIHVSQTSRGWWNNISEGAYGTEIIGIKTEYHDVGVTDILLPSTEVFEATNIKPSAIIKNYGLDVETFFAVFKIDDLYSDSIFITLLPDQMDTVYFSDWYMDESGTYNLSCYTNLYRDLLNSNDTAWDKISLSLIVESSPSVKDISYCLNQSANSLSATPTYSHYDLFYFTGESSSNPQSFIIPSTDVIGTTIYYVAEGLSESNFGPRVPIKVTVNPIPFAFAGLDTNICAGNSVQLGEEPSPGNSYTWYSDPVGFSSSISNPVVTPEISTRYFVIKTIIETGCADTAKMNKGILVHPIPNADFIPSREVAIVNANLEFENKSSEAVSYKWDFNDNTQISNDINPNHIYSEIGYYNVCLTVVSKIGCTDTVSKKIAITNDKLHPPTGFSPNSENIEDREFRIHSPDIKENGYNLLIFNRWGEVIFEISTQEKGWDGKMKNGNPAPAGVYIWVLQYIDFIGQTRKQQGQITLLY